LKRNLIQVIDAKPVTIVSISAIEKQLTLITVDDGDRVHRHSHSKTLQRRVNQDAEVVFKVQLQRMALRLLDQAGVLRLGLEKNNMSYSLFDRPDLAEGTCDLMARQLGDSSNKTSITEKLKD
jgi:hypothetical protein